MDRILYDNEKIIIFVAVIIVDRINKINRKQKKLQQWQKKLKKR